MGRNMRSVPHLKTENGGVDGGGGSSSSRSSFVVVVVVVVMYCLCCMLLVAGGLPTNNAVILPEFTNDPLTLSGSVNTDNSSIAESMAPVGMTSSISTVTHFPPSSNMSSVLPLPAITSATQLPFTSDSITGVMSNTTTPWQPPPHQLSVVAGVDLSQLPPLQRQLFLRIHQQQKETAINTTSAVTSAASQHPAPSQPVTAVIPPPGMTSVV